MYIKFCRGYGEDKKYKASANSSSESELSVELEGKKDTQTKGKTWLYRLACVILTIICLVLLLVVILLSMKLQSGSTACPDREGTTVLNKESAPTCGFNQCQALFPNVKLQYLGCRQCADGWLTFGRSCFYLSTFRLSWDESQRNCSSRGGSLAVITSPDIQTFLTQKGNLKYWIGLRQTGPTWGWVNNKVLGKSYWEDVTSDADCGILKSQSPPEKNWAKASCQASSYFICQLWI
ncbi:early activation antigen CD69 isoform X2 [Notolabrus celidotus]|uniref:early activation antigen CD69 isoform X2 n=1 Tax=Notolabrus celidotus TaxID=1203425 RepID=UPI00148FD0F2|nr:early activation antigen CD69 isoform X2 [Notolabrus celidotus]